MTVHCRSYQKQVDFQRVGDFLTRHFQPGNRDGNWLQPTWEYMHSHPYLDESSLDRIGIWEEAGEIVGVAHYESRLGEVFLEIHPDYAWYKREMLDYSEKRLFGTTPTEDRFIQVFVNDFDAGLETLVRDRGYQRDPDNDRPMSMLEIPVQVPDAVLASGFTVQSLQDDNDLHKIDRVLWCGFNHPGEPPADGIEGRKKMQSTPNFRKDLTIVVAAPDGQFACFCGLWYDPVNHLAYVEPLATDPDYRRMGLARAAIWEGIRRCQALGATVAFVGSDQLFYRSIGFQKIYTSQCWRRELSNQQ